MTNETRPLIESLDATAQPSQSLGEAPTDRVRDVADPLDVVVIAGVAENGVIGAGGGIPWDYPADMAHFREATTGHPVVMGRRTFQNITGGLGEPLPDRTSIVLTSQGLDGEFAAHDAVCEAADLEEAFRAATRACETHGVERVYVAGGASVYAAVLPLADRLLLTRIPETPDGDTSFPACDPDDWELVGSTERDDVTVEEYVRRGVEGE